MNTTRQAKGFTLIELVMVMVVLVIVAAVANMRMPGEGIKASAQAEQLASDIRYTQSLAMSRGQRYRVNFTANSYQITDMSNVAQAHPSTGQTAAIALTPAVLSNYLTVYGNNYVAFDSLGVPYTAATVAQTDVATMTLTSGGEAINITVAPQTGRVQVQ